MNSEEKACPAAPTEPFVGIRPYTRAHAAIFFERREEARNLLETVLTRRTVMLYGDSGNGKSSLINAGLVPMLESSGFKHSLQPEVIRINRDQSGNIGGLVIDRNPLASKFEGIDNSPFESLFTDKASGNGTKSISLSVREVVQRLRTHHSLHSNRKVLLIFDQFEELYTLGRSQMPLTSYRDRNSSILIEDREVSRLRLAAEIGELLSATRSEGDDNDRILPLKFLFVFREEYLVKLQALVPDLLNATSVRLPIIPEGRLANVMKGPFLAQPDSGNDVAAPFSGHELASFFLSSAEALHAAFKARAGGVSQNVLTELQVVSLSLWRNEHDRQKIGECQIGAAHEMGVPSI